MCRQSQRRAAGLGLCVSSTLLALLPLLSAPLSTVPAAALGGPDDGLVVRYDLDETSGTVVADSSGNGRDATLMNGATWAGNGRGVTLDGTNDYVDLPDNLLAGLSEISVSIDVKIDASQAGGSWMWGLGNTGGNGNGNGYLFTTGNAYRTSIATGNWSTEQTVTKGSNLARGVWKTLTYSLGADDVAVLYEDGVEVARKTGVTIGPGSIGGGTTTANYLGRSLYNADAYLKGMVRGFRIYDRALTADEALELSGDDTERVAADTALLDLGDTSAVTADLTLPTVLENGSTVAWASSTPAVVSATGAVTRPPFGEPAAMVTLTATLTRGTASETKTFEVTVLPLPSPQERVDAVADSLAGLPSLTRGEVRGSLTLPETGAMLAREVDVDPQGLPAVITWHSSDPAAISDSDAGSGSDLVDKGFVTRSDAPRDVTLTATVSLPGSEAEPREVGFDVTVPAEAGPADEDLEAYAFAYFTADTISGEKIRMAVSKGNDALRWNTLNGGNPVLESTKGDLGVRDPFVMRSHEGDRFFLLATDLSVGRHGWSNRTRFGSYHLEIWESTDLVHWGEQRHVRVAPDNFGMVWAPEAYYDETIGAYVVYWTSSTYTDGTRTTATGTNPKIFYATTRDFVTFTDPQPWLLAEDVAGLDASRGLIDATVLKEGDTYYRFTKGTDASGCASADIFGQRSTSLRAPGGSGAWSEVSRCIGRTAGTPEVEGPSVFRANTDDVNGHRFYLWVDNYGGIGYIPLYTDSLDSPTWTKPPAFSLPASPRHGGVVPITREERDGLVAAYNPELLVTSVAQATVRVTIGTTTATLPQSAVATFGDGHTENLAVAWDDHSLDGVDIGDSVVVQGDLANGAAVRASVQVMVVPQALSASILGTAEVGSTLTASTTPGWSDVTYTWFSGDEPTGVTTATYDVRPEDVGRVIRVEVEAVDPDGGEASAVAETVPTAPCDAAITVTPSVVKVAYGRAARLQVEVASPGSTPTGDVTVHDGTRLLATATLSGGSATLTLPARLAVGRHVLTVRYPGGPAWTAAATTSTVVVTKAATTTRVEAPSRVAAGAMARVTVRVTARGVTPTGAVRIYDRGRLVRTVRLRDGRATTRLEIRGDGRHRLVAKYAGTAWAAASQAATTVTAR